MNRKAKPLEAVPNIAPAPIPAMVRTVVDGEEMCEVASFVAGRVRCVFDHNGNAEITMRVPFENQDRVFALAKYPGIEMRFVAAIPAGAIE